MAPCLPFHAMIFMKDDHMDKRSKERKDRLLFITVIVAWSAT